MFGKFEESQVIKPPLCPYNSCPLMLVPCTLWPVILLPGLRPNKSLTRAYDRFQGLLCVFGCLCPKKGGHGGRWRPIWIPFWWLLHSPGRTQKIQEYGVRGYYMLWTTSWLSEWRSKMIQSQSLPLNVVHPWYGPAKWINQHKSNPKLCLLMFFQH